MMISFVKYRIGSDFNSNLNELSETGLLVEPGANAVCPTSKSIFKGL
jgi:hypothetical protein